MKPPPYVAIVLPPFVRLEFLDAAKRDQLMGHGFTVESDASGYSGIRFPDTGGDLLSNEAFVEMFRRLNEAGLAFAEDFTQGWAPADLMRELQLRTRITAPFTAITWRGSDNWLTTFNEPQSASR